MQLAPAATSADTSALVLSYRQPGFLGQTESGEPLLQRELWRQALLLAAREELGLPVHDEVTSGPVDQVLSARFDQVISGKQKLVLTKRYGPLVFQGKAPGLELWRLAPGESHGMLRRPLPAATVSFSGVDRPDSTDGRYLETAGRLEPLTRTSIVALLNTLGYELGAAATTGQSSVPAEIETLLADTNEIAQYSAVVQLHALIRQHGESAALLGALSRAYAQLGLQTDSLFNATSQALTARSLLYARRAAHRDSASALAPATMAYALALAGLHADALAELKRSRQATDFASVTLAHPWITLIEPYCRYDDRALRTIASAGGPLAPRAALLRLCSVDHEPADAIVCAAAEEVLRLDPACLRAHDSIARRLYLDPTGAASDRGLSQFLASYPQRLAQLPGLPAPIATKAAALAARSDAPPADHRQLIDELIAAGEIGKPGADPAHAELGWLLRELLFRAAFRRAQFVHGTASLTAAQAKAEHDRLNALTRDHPYFHMIHRYTIQREPLDPRTIIRSTPVRDWTLSLDDLLIGNLATLPHEVEPTSHSVLPLLPAGVWADRTARDLDGLLARRPDTPWRRREQLQEASPHNAYAAARSAARPSSDGAVEKRAVQRLGHRPSFWRARAEWHLDMDERDAARDALRHLLDIAPADAWTIRQLATLAWWDGQDERGAEALEPARSTTMLPTVERSRALEDLARHWLEQGDLDRAATVAQELHDLSPMRPAQLRVACAGWQGRWDEAHDWVRAAAVERGGAFAEEYYLWCRRTGHGDPAAAAALVRQVFAARAKAVAEAWAHAEPKHRAMHEAQRHSARVQTEAVFHLLEGNVPKALALFEQVSVHTKQVVPALYASVILLDLGDRSGARDYALRAAPPGSLPAENERPWLQAMAWLVALHQVENSDALLDTVTVDLLLRDAPAEDRPIIAYVAGMYLKHQGRPDLSERYLRRAVPAVYHGTLAETLAGVELRNRGLDPFAAATTAAPPTPATQPAVDELIVELQLRENTALRVMPSGLYFAHQYRTLDIKRREPNRAWVNGTEWTPRWRQPSLATFPFSSTGWPLEMGSLRFRIASLVCSRERGGAHVEGLGAAEPSAERGEWIVHLANTQPGPIWYRLTLARDPSVLDAADTASRRPLRPGDAWLVKRKKPAATAPVSPER